MSIRTTKRWAPAIRLWSTVPAVLLASVTIAAWTPAAADAAPSCGIGWGSLDKAAGNLSTAPIVNVRAGQHPCYDRLIVDVAGAGVGYRAGYAPAVHTQARGDVLPLRGGAFLGVVVLNSTYDTTTGAPTYVPANRNELVDVTGWRTFRQVAYGGSFEGYTTIGVGLQARLPFRVFTLSGPGAHTRLVIDVAAAGLAAPVAAEQTASLHVTPSTVPAGGSVEVTGTCDPNSEGFAISTAFLHDATHDFAGVGAAAFHTDPAGHFSVTAQVPTNIMPGQYSASARCGGGNLGIAATLTVIPASGPPTAVPAGSGGLAASKSARTEQRHWLIAGIGVALLVGGGLGALRLRRTTR